jgi:hypothetical protein
MRFCSIFNKQASISSEYFRFTTWNSGLRVTNEGWSFLPVNNLLLHPTNLLFQLSRLRFRRQYCPLLVLFPVSVVPLWFFASGANLIHTPPTWHPSKSMFLWKLHMCDVRVTTFYWVVHKFVNFNNLGQTCSNLESDRGLSNRPGVWPKVRGEDQKSKSQSQH